MPLAPTIRDASTAPPSLSSVTPLLAGDSLIPQVQPAPLPRAMVWSVLFLIYTGIAILLTDYRYLDDLSRNRPGTFGIRALEEITGVYTAFVLLPLRALRSPICISSAKNA